MGIVQKYMEKVIYFICLMINGHQFWQDNMTF